jgi:hypothetical protein
VVSSTEQHQKPRNPFDDDEKLEVDPVGALCDRIDWLRDQQHHLTGGTQIVVSGQQNTDRKIDALTKTVNDETKALAAAIVTVAKSADGNHGDMRWLKGLIFLLLLERVAVHVFATAPAKAVLAMVSP